MAALWGLQRALRFAGDQLTLKGAGQPGPFLRDAEKAAYRYYHTLPRDIRNALEGDVPGSFQTADALLGAASKLRAYLEAEQAEAVRAEPSSVGGRVGSRFSRAWASLKES